MYFKIEDAICFCADSGFFNNSANFSKLSHPADLNRETSSGLSLMSEFMNALNLSIFRYEISIFTNAFNVCKTNS